MKFFKSIFPFDQTEIAEYKIMSNAEVDTALQQSEKAFLQWNNTSFYERSVVLKKVADLLIERKKRWRNSLPMKWEKF